MVVAEYNLNFCFLFPVSPRSLVRQQSNDTILMQGRLYLCHYHCHRLFRPIVLKKCYFCLTRAMLSYSKSPDDSNVKYLSLSLSVSLSFCLCSFFSLYLSVSPFSLFCCLSLFLFLLSLFLFFFSLFLSMSPFFSFFLCLSLFLSFFLCFCFFSLSLPFTFFFFL